MREIKCGFPPCPHVIKTKFNDGLPSYCSHECAAAHKNYVPNKTEGE